ncbi:MAG: class I SAM-dependent methyltransferase [Candidatus Heimdallarchaeota archaeon]|nr:class I SAM-dependent methyltransferase [Candidatus Heimdallarchaeota archaeon]
MDDQEARRYDRMIDWETRLNREIPIISSYLEPGTLLDMACSSGRHSFALEKQGFSCLGVDISTTFIDLAEEIKAKEGYTSKFVCFDATSAELRDQLAMRGMQYADNAIMLGNAVANTGSGPAGRAMLENIYLMLKPGGKFFVQTVNRPSKPYYMPLRELDGGVLQRIQMPNNDPTTPQNAELHINHIKGLEYVKQDIGGRFFMYTYSEFKLLIEDIGFIVEGVAGGYNNEPLDESGGATVIWKLRKPTIEITEEAMLMTGLEAKELERRVLHIWQDLYADLKYYCVSRSRFIHPRITGHPRYATIHLKHKRILDLGCALGTDLMHMVYRGADPSLLTGVDASPLMLSKIEHLFGPSSIRFVSGDVAADEFTDLNGISHSIFDEPYDIVFTGSLLHLMSKEAVKRLIGRVFASLVADGVFFGRLVLINGAPGDDIEYFGYLHNESSFHSLLETSGFRDIELLHTGLSTHQCEQSYGDLLTYSFYCIK